MIEYTPPVATDLQDIKDSLGLTGQQMAELLSVAGGQQWRKYTGGEKPRSLSLHALFFLAARLSLSNDELARVRSRMQQIGADVGEITAVQSQ